MNGNGELPIDKVICGDCLEVMKEWPAASVDCIVTDPPYGLSFMGKAWDKLGDIGKTSHGGIASQPGFKGFRLPSHNGSSNVRCGKCGKWKWDYPERKCCCEQPVWPNIKGHQANIMQSWHYAWAVEALRVAKPGAMMLAFGGTRTYHRLTCAIEDAGWEIRDCIMYIYGSGFPKSCSISKQLDKAAGVEPIDCGPHPNARQTLGTVQICKKNGSGRLTRPASDAAKEWEGWGTALKPAYEPILLCMKPLDGTFAENALKHGVAGLNIDGCRVPSGDIVGASGRWGMKPEKGWNSNNMPSKTSDKYEHTQGRWPANLVIDGSEEVVRLFPETKSGALTSAQQVNGGFRGAKNCYGTAKHGADGDYAASSGSAARFFYVAKASKAERNAGCEGLEAEQRDTTRKQGNPGGDNPRNRGVHPMQNYHPTVKPLALMKYLVKLVSREGHVVLDPFAGSGTTGMACEELGRHYILIDTEEGCCEISRSRIRAIPATLPFGAGK